MLLINYDKNPTNFFSKEYIKNVVAKFYNKFNILYIFSYLFCI